MPAVEYFCGLDLGQSSDPSALSALECTRKPSGDPLLTGLQNHFVCSYLNRFPLGTSYVKIIDDVVRLFDRPPLCGAKLIVDYTGVGRPVFDMFHARKELQAQVIPLTFSGSQMGMKAHYTKGVGWVVPKRDLAGAVQAALGQRRFQVARLRERETLVKELRTFTVKINPKTSNASYEHYRDKDHDDLVFAVAMPLWFADWAGRVPRGLRTYELNRKKKDLLRFVACTTRELELLDVQDHPAMLVFLSDPGPTADNKVGEHKILRVRDELRLSFGAFEPSEHEQTWTIPQEKWGGLTPEQAQMRQEHAKRFWAFFQKRREPRPEVVVVVDDNVSRGLSLCLGACDALGLVRAAIWVPSQADRVWKKEDAPPLKHVWGTTRSCKGLVVA